MRMNKFFVLALLAGVILLGCVGTQSSDTGNVVQGASAVKEFSLTAKSFSFDPATIEVNEGDHVRVHISNVDTIGHGFALLDFGVNAYLEPGKTATVDFTASKKGEFTYFCSFFCGKGHKDMKGKLVVN